MPSACLGRQAEFKTCTVGDTTYLASRHPRHAQLGWQMEFITCTVGDSSLERSHGTKAPLAWGARLLQVDQIEVDHPAHGVILEVAEIGHSMDTALIEMGLDRASRLPKRLLVVPLRLDVD